MTTNIFNSSQGRYIAYSQDIDKTFFNNHEIIDKIKFEKVHELLKENPFNLENSSGIKLAQETIANDLEKKISDLSGSVFKEVRMDIASSVLSSYIMSNKK